MSQSNLSGETETNPIPTHQKGSSSFRLLAVTPIASVVTAGLMLSMTGLIATEYRSQDKAPPADFAVNMDETDIIILDRTVTIDPLRKVEVPPPPTPIDTIKTAEVVVPDTPLGGAIEPFDPPDLDFKLGAIVESDAEAKPILRIPPVTPPRFLQGNHSGYCKVVFDVSPEGQPFNVFVSRCTNRMLESATIKSVQKWKYKAKVRDGRAVSRSGVQTTVQFNLEDERGALLPVPSEY